MHVSPTPIGAAMPPPLSQEAIKISILHCIHADFQLNSHLIRAMVQPPAEASWSSNRATWHSHTDTVSRTCLHECSIPNFEMHARSHCRRLSKESQTACRSLIMKRWCMPSNIEQTSRAHSYITSRSTTLSYMNLLQYLVLLTDPNNRPDSAPKEAQ
jgi:hypothetical protein